MRFLTKSIASFLMMSLACVVVGRADIIIGDFFTNSNAPKTARRYRESDAGLVSTALLDGETVQGITLGPDETLDTSANDVGIGSIHRYNARTGAALTDLVPGNFPLGKYQMPNGLTIIGNSIFSTSRAVIPSGVTGVVRFDATTGDYLGTPVEPGDHGLGTPGSVDRAPNGDLLVGDGNRINRYNADTGAFINTFIAGATGFGGSTFGPDGDFYVCSSDGIDRYDGTTGASLGNFISNISATTCTFGNDGNLYALVEQPFPLKQDVFRYDGTTGAFIDTFITILPGTLPGYLITAPDTPEPMFAAIASVLIAIASLRRCRGIT